MSGADSATATRLASISKLNGANYASWSYQMKLVLMESDLWTIISPGEEKPAESEAGTLRKYVARQGKALAKICLAIDDEQQQHVQHLDSPREVWNELEKLYAPKDSRFRIVQLRRKLYSEKLSENESVDSYLGRLNRTVTQLVSVGDTIDDSDLAMTILCGLPENWDIVVSAICNLPDSEFTCANVKRKLIAESERRNNTPNREIGAMSIKAERRHDEKRHVFKGKKITRKAEIKCYRCGGKGHFARDCSSNQNAKTNRCEKAGRKPAYDMLLACNMTTADVADAWIIDSGATHHMTPNENYFSMLERRNDDIDQVTTANGTTTPTSGKGTAYAKIINGRGSIDHFTAKNTIYVPGIRHSVLSVLQLTENNRKVVFDGQGCHIYDDEDNVLMEGERHGRLFLIRAKPTLANESRAVENLLAQGKGDPLELWHRRFMHVSEDTVLKMCKSESVRGLDCCAVKSSSKCDDCLKGKSTRQPFPKSHSTKDKPENEPLSLVHSDLMGPLDVHSWGGARYMLSIVDDATRYVRVYFLKKKGDVLAKFKEWMQEAERQTQKHLKRVRTDNGLEFCSNAWDTFCKAKGIVHERTMVYTPQQNGVAERMNRTLLDLVRSTISSSNLPKESWAELTYTAAYIRNRVTNKHNNEKTPYELWFKRKPSVRHLKACGCDTFVHIPKEQRRSKLDSRAYKGKLVGYALNGRGWRVWIPEKRRVIESRDCTFKEDAIRPLYEPELPNVQLYTEDKSDVDMDEDYHQDDSEESKSPTPENESQEGEQTIQRRRKQPAERSHPMILRHMTELQLAEANELTEAQMIKSNSCMGKQIADNVNLHKLDRSPGSYQEAIQCIDAAKWLEAMEDEMTSIAEHNVWELAELPENIKPIKCRWVLNKKVGPSGETVRYKARLVAKGFSQREGLEYDEVYAPVSSFETIRLLTAIAVEENWIIDQYDVKCAYLNGDLDREIYMEQPEGFVIPGQEHYYCKLKKAIYGLKQSGRCWNEHMDKCLRESGFTRSPVDPCVYQITQSEGVAILSTYVDDILCISQNEHIRRRVKELLQKQFENRFIGPADYLLGVQFTHHEDGGVSLTQERYVDQLLDRFNMREAKDVATPMEVRPNFSNETGDQDNDNHNLPFRELIGALMYLSQRTRPDIAFAVNKLAQYSTDFARKHWIAAKRILRYVKSTKNMGITYKRVGKPLLAYADADWATCTESRKSTSGYIVMLANAPILWRSAKQTTIALSTMEAEYVALSECVREITWIRQFLIQLQFESFVREPTLVHSDSQAAIAHSNSYVDKSRTKHIALKYHFTRERIRDGTVELNFIPSEENCADILTKSLGKIQHQRHRQKLVSAAK